MTLEKEMNKIRPSNRRISGIKRIIVIDTFGRSLVNPFNIAYTRNIAGNAMKDSTSTKQKTKIISILERLVFWYLILVQTAVFD